MTSTLQRRPSRENKTRCNSEKFADNTARRDTKIMINIVPPSQDLPVDQDEKQNKGAKDKSLKISKISEQKSLMWRFI